MKQKTDELKKALTIGLQEIAVEAENKLQMAERSLQVIDQIIGALKEYMRSYTFKEEQEEIHFFKEIKPYFLRERFYFEALYHFESRKPIGTEENVKRYYEYNLNKIQDYFDQNRLFYNYYLSGATDLDNFYYVRNAPQMPRQFVYNLDLDGNFSLPYSNKLAKVQAFEQARNYIYEAIYRKEETVQPEAGNETDIWSAKDVDMVEMAAGLYYSGAVNYGKGGFTRFVTRLASHFNVRLNNVPRIIYGMTIRKKEDTPFLNSVTAGYRKMLEERNR